MKANSLVLFLLLIAYGETIAVPPSPTDVERNAVIEAAIRYNNRNDTNALGVIESFHKRFPDYGGIGVSRLKNDDHTRSMFYRLFYELPTGAKCRKWLIYKLALAPESDALLKLFIETALNKQEDEETRIAAINDLLGTQWSKAHLALTEIYLKIEDEKYHAHMLDVAIYNKKAALAEVFLGYYRQFHPEQEARYAKHFDRFQEMKVKLAEDAKNPKPDPLVLIKAQQEWWDNFIKRERKLTLAQAKAGLKDFAKSPVLDRLELAYSLQQTGVADAEVLQSLERLIPGEPDGFVRMAMIQSVAAQKPTPQARLQYYRHIAKTEKDLEVLKAVQVHIKILEESPLKK